VWALVELLSIPDEYAIGLLLVGFASAGPLGIKAAQIAGADVACAVSLVVVLEAATHWSSRCGSAC
jgi:predicted Na+-dependent transporter